jgi:SAM-dependent methyltransferase
VSAAERRHLARVEPLPAWLDVARLLGPTREDDVDGRGWQLEPGALAGTQGASAMLDGERAADLAARLRNLVLDGQPLACTITPPLARTQVRAGRLAEARRHRSTSIGFARAGTQLDDEGRWSLTPEALALELGHMAARRRVVDAGCSVGGNAIGFARAECEVVAIERSRERVAMARHNAARYGVAARIRFVEGDALALAGQHVAPGTIVFVDPPWGREASERATLLADMPLLVGMLALARERGAALWAKLPPAFDTRTLPGGQVRAMFGVGQGDARRVKFVLVRIEPDA